MKLPPQLDKPNGNTPRNTAGNTGKKLEREANKLFDEAIKGKQAHDLGIWATPEQVAAVVNAAETAGIDKKKFETAFKKSDKRQSTLRSLFLRYYKKANTAAGSAEPEDNPEAAGAGEHAEEEPKPTPAPAISAEPENTPADPQTKTEKEQPAADPEKYTEEEAHSIFIELAQISAQVAFNFNDIIGGVDFRKADTNEWLRRNGYTNLIPGEKIREAAGAEEHTEEEPEATPADNDDIIKHYSDLYEAARREFIPLVEGIDTNTGARSADPENTSADPQAEEPEPATEETPAAADLRNQETETKTEPQDKYTAEELSEIGRELINYSKNPALDISKLYNHARANGNDRAAVNTWLNANGLKYAIPGNSPAEQYIRRHTAAEQGPTPAGTGSAEPENTPAEPQKQPAAHPLILTIYPNQRPNSRTYTAEELERNSAAKYYSKTEAENIKDDLIEADRDPSIIEPAREPDGYYDKYKVDLIIFNDFKNSRTKHKEAAKEITPAAEEPQAGLLDIIDENGSILKADGNILDPDSEEAQQIRNEAAKEAKDDLIRNKAPWNRDPNFMGRAITTTIYGMFDTANDMGYRDRLKAEIDAGGPWLIFDKLPETKKGDGTLKGLWNCWNGTAFIPNTINAHTTAERVIESVLKYEIPKLQADVNKINEADQAAAQKRLNDFITSARNAKCRARKQAMLDLLKYSEGVSINLEIDGNYNLLSCKNGILDTEKGIFYTDKTKIDILRRLMPHHYIDRVYTPGLKPEKFLKHLETVFTDSVDMDLTDAERKTRATSSVNCFGRYIGYGLTGDNKECKFLFLIGQTANNGKSTTIDIIDYVVGGAEFQRGNMKELQTDAAETSSSIRQGITKRFIYFAELSQGEKTGNKYGAKISRDQVKKISDIGRIPIRGLYEDSEGVPIVALPMATANETPAFDKTIDRGFLRRLVIIPFNHIFDNDDNDLKTATKDIKGYAKTIVEEEGDAIFSYLVDECIAYCKYGLIEEPEHWQQERDALLNTSIIPDFIEETYTPIRSPERHDARRIYFKQVFEDIVIYAELNNRAAELGKAGESTISYTGQNGKAVTTAAINNGMKREIAEALNIKKFIIGNAKKGSSIDPNKYIYAEYKDPERQAAHMKRVNNTTNIYQW